MGKSRSYINFLLLVQSLLAAISISGYSDLELNARKVESLYMREIIRKIKQLNYNVKAFYHVSGWQQFWKDVVKQQLKILDGREPYVIINGTKKILPKIENSILSLVDELHITAAGVDDHYKQDFHDIENFILNHNISYKHKIQIHQSRTFQRSTFDHANDSYRIFLNEYSKAENITEGEVSTINALHSYCSQKKKNNTKAFVLYFHSKSGCCHPNKEHLVKVNWRNKMNMYTLEFPSLCLRALLNGYTACGTDLLVRTWAHAHFQGNFWWANCDYIAALPPMTDPFKWQECEFFIFNVSLIGSVRDEFSQRCGFHVSQFGRLRGGRENDPFSREDYLEHIRMTYFSRVKEGDEDVMSRINADLESGPFSNHPPGKKMDRRWVQEQCEKTWQQPYASQRSWKVLLSLSVVVIVTSDYQARPTRIVCALMCLLVGVFIYCVVIFVRVT